jgi:hypothetical protein
MSSDSNIFYTPGEMMQWSERLIDLCYANYISRDADFSGVGKYMKVQKLRGRVYRIENTVVQKGNVVIDAKGNVYRVADIKHKGSHELPSLELYRNDGKYIMASKILHHKQPLNYHVSVSKEYRDKLDKICETTNHFDIDGFMLGIGEVYVFDDTYAQRLIDAPKYEIYNRKEEAPIKKENYGINTSGDETSE